MSDPRLADGPTRRLLEGPIAATLLRLAAPGVIMLVAQVAINVLEAYFVGRLGPDALAGISVTFPLVMLMQTMSAGGMGGGVASAVARALGAGRRAHADALVAHAIVIALVLGGVFTAVVLPGGRPLYHAMGARDGALEAAVAYSRVVFAGAIAVWLFNTLASVVRGTGNMVLPAVVTLGGGAVLVTLPPALVTMVGTNVGAGQRERAVRVAWTGALMAGAVTETIGLAAALFPHAWLRLFSGDPDVVAAGASYLRLVGPAYGFFGLGLALYFASQGAGRLLWPVIAGTLRLFVAAAGGWLILHWAGGPLGALFLVMAVALVVFGGTLAGAIRLGAWDAPRAAS